MKRYAIIPVFIAVMLSGCAATETLRAESPVFSEKTSAVSAEAVESGEDISTEPLAPTSEPTDEPVSEETVETVEPIPEELSEYEAAAKKILTDIITKNDIIVKAEYELTNSLYRIDLFDITGDGVPELFVNTVQSAGAEGFLDIYDIAAGERLATLVDHTYNLSVCTDEENNTHYIIRSEEWLNMSGCNQFVAYFDLRYSDGELNISVPFFGGPTGWFEETGEHKFINQIFKDNGYSHECTEDGECYHHNQAYHHFIEGELIGEYEVGNSLGYTVEGLGEEDSEEIGQLIQELVFDGLTVQELRTGTRTEQLFSKENADEMWDSVSYMFDGIEM